MKEVETVASIDKEMAELAERRQKLLAKSRGEELEKTKAAIKTYGFTAAELEIENVVVKRTRKARAANGTRTTPVKKTPPKYANPKNPEETWGGGKGAKPTWVKELLKAGVDIETTLIKK